MSLIKQRDPELGAEVLETLRSLLQERWGLKKLGSITATPLHGATESGDVDKARQLMERGKYSVNCTDSIGWTPLHYACAVGSLDLVRMLVSEFRADTSIQDVDGRTALMLAALAGHDIVVNVLLSEYQCNVDTKDRKGIAAIHYACGGGCIGVLISLIEKNHININAKTNNHNTPLHIAALNGKEEVALMLIDKFSCDPNIRNHNGWSLLHSACEGGSVTLVRSLILNHEAVINARNCDNDTPLHIAAYHGKTEVALALINDFGCDASTTGYKGWSLLHSACHGGSTSLVKVLINEHNLSPLAVDDYFDTPLHKCVASGHGECVEVLLHVNAFVMMRNKAGKTPMDIASNEIKLLFQKHFAENKDEIYRHYNTIRKESKKRFSGAKRIIRVFVVGNPGAGKSSLIESLKREGIIDSLRKVSESSVPLHTAGIVPSTHSKRSKLFLFYDFAGDPEYYSSHAAILEQFVSSRKGDNIFIIVVDLRDNDENFKNILHYWLSFIRHHKFLESPFVIFVGSHSDQIPKVDVTDSVLKFKLLCAEIQSKEPQKCPSFVLNCCQPGAKKIQKLQTEISTLTEESPQYKLSPEASVLLGLFERDFKYAVVCSLDNLLNHITYTHIRLPTSYHDIQPYISELHDLGMLLMIEGKESQSMQIVLKPSMLCNTVHQLLFSKDGRKNFHDACKNLSSCKMGIIPGDVLFRFLPEYITTECLVQLQYCQEISYRKASPFPSVTASDPTDQTFLFFPALISSSKSESELSWITPPDDCYSISWLAQCNEINNFFPPRFLHVLLLRLVFRFSVSPDSDPQRTTPSTPVSPFNASDSYSDQTVVKLDDATVSAPVYPQHVSSSTGIAIGTIPDLDIPLSPSTASTPDLSPSTALDNAHSTLPDYFKRHCTMWKTGVHWLMEEGVECMVELVDGSKGVVMTARSEQSANAQCEAIFGKIVSCVMEARTEFCHDVKPEIFLLKSSDESKYHSEDNHFALRSVERVLAQPQQKLAINSVSGKDQMKTQYLVSLRQLIHWYTWFPLDYIFVLQNLEDFVKENNYPSLSNIGIIPPMLLQDLLPSNVTKESIVQHQYCQEFSLKDLGSFPNLSLLPKHIFASFLIFPALLKMEKGDISWKTPSNFTNSIGWLAKSTTSFPSNFLVVILLNIAFRFTMVQDQASTLPFPHNYTSRCSMWRRGVYWFMKEGGAECMVELADGNRSVVVTTKCEQDMEEECMHALSEVVKCVVDVISDNCPSFEVSFFLLDSTEDPEILNISNHFAIVGVKEMLLSTQKEVALLSVTGRKFLQMSRLTYLNKLALWYKFFPIDRAAVLKHLKDVVGELMNLGLHLGLCLSVLEEIEEDFPSSCDRRRMAMLKRWMSSTDTPPCWWHLTRALREIEMGVLAAEIERDHRDHIQLQEKLLTEANKSCRPDPEFLQSFAAVVGSDWHSLATSLQLGESIEKGKDLSPQDHASRMLKNWASREDATYGQLCTALQAIPLFQYNKC